MGNEVVWTTSETPRPIVSAGRLTDNFITQWNDQNVLTQGATIAWLYKIVKGSSMRKVDILCLQVTFRYTHNTLYSF